MNNRFLLTTALTLGFVFAPIRGYADIFFSDFSSVSGMQLSGNASQSGSNLRLTSALPSTHASAWFDTQQSIQNGFSSTFQFQITGIGGNSVDQEGNPGADGLAFVIQNSSDTALGNAAAGMGYQGIPNSLAIEFDTWMNPASAFPQGLVADPNGNHVSVHTRGTLANSADEAFSLGWTTQIPNMSDGNIHNVEVVYLPGSLSIYLDDFSTPRLTVSVDLASELNLNAGDAWLGFTAGTGNAWENHDVLNWSVTTVPEPSSIVLAALGFLGMAAWRRLR